MFKSYIRYPGLGKLELYGRVGFKEERRHMRGVLSWK